MKNQPFIIPLAGLVSGLLLGELLPESKWYAFGLILLGLILVFYLGSRLISYGSVLLFLFFLVLGIVRNQASESLQGLSSPFLAEKEWTKLKIENTYRSSEKFRKYKAEILAIDSAAVRQSYLLLYWKKENPALHYNDEIWVYGKIRPTDPPKNPYQFDYKNYLSRQQIHYVLYSDSIFKIEKTGKSLYNHFAKFKSEIRKKLIDEGYSRHTTDIIGAMLLGDRTEMDDEIEENYRKTGVVHILSISGLHVVMVYTIFYLLLYPLVYLPKGKIWRIIFSLVFIWAYAAFVEMQPPVARSALMISAFHLSMVLRRKPNIFHTLAVSAFILLLVNPYFLFDVGFQLSYSAVFFIVWLMPVYRKILPVRNRKLSYIRDFVGTSISAQAGTFPIAAYYFHQSSGLFLAGNVLMIPASFIMICGGMLSVLLASLNIHFSPWVWLFNGFFEWVNAYIAWLSSHETWVFENISFSLTEVFLLISMVVCLRFLVSKNAPKFLILGLLLFFLFQLNRIQKTHYFKQKEEIIVFHQYKNSVVGIRKGIHLDVFIAEENEMEKLIDYILKPYLVNEGVFSVKYFQMDEERVSNYIKTKNLILWNGKKIFILNRNMDLRTASFDYILVQNYSKPNLDSISAEIILDGSNYPNYLNDRMVWRTAESGAKRIIP